MEGEPEIALGDWGWVLIARLLRVRRGGPLGGVTLEGEPERAVAEEGAAVSYKLDGAGRTLGDGGCLWPVLAAAS